MKPRLPGLCVLCIVVSLGIACAFSGEREPQVLPGTQLLSMEGDLAALMVGGIDRYLDRVSSAASQKRTQYWNRDFSSPEAYVKSVETNRQRLATILGVVDKREPVALVCCAACTGDLTVNPAQIGRGNGFRIFSVAWNVFRGVRGEGLLLIPEGEAKASMVAIPDCDWTPEQLVGLQEGLPPSSQFARRLAEAGCRVIIPFLVDRSDTCSGLPGVRALKQSQREVLWRAGYEMGRTITGYEVQKVLAAVHWLAGEQRPAEKTSRIGVVGFGEGGLIACFAGALDPRLDLVVVSGYLPNQNLQEEPICRDIWSLMAEFGAGGVAGLITPRKLIWEHGDYPEAEYPAAGRPHDGAAPGKLGRPGADVSSQIFQEMAKWLQDVPGSDRWKLIHGRPKDVVNDETLSAISEYLGLSRGASRLAAGVTANNPPPDNTARRLRQYTQILEDTQWLMREAEHTRAEFWRNVDRKDAASFAKSARWYRDYLLNEIVGSLPAASLPPNPRSRKVSETDAFTGYEVVLDVHPDVFAYGILLVPKGIKAGEKRPVVICQHGLEGRPVDVADPNVDSQYYHAFACRLAERGFITFAPQNCYIGGNRFRQVLRKAQPLKLTLWSFILRQHEVILEWLATREFVDPRRVAFYGLSYGGKTAMRIPQLLDGYCLSICSADYNEWIWKNVSSRSRYSYLYTGEYDMPEFNMGNTFNYAELSWLMIPRPFMVERGHNDGVAPDEWVAYEFAKTRRQYVQLGLGENTGIEFFNGPHTINGKGTFDFLAKHLDWPGRR